MMKCGCVLCGYLRQHWVKRENTGSGATSRSPARSKDGAFTGIGGDKDKNDSEAVRL